MFSEKLRRLRRENGLTQNELGKQLNVSNGTIAMWETGKRQPDLETITQIASFFNVSLDYLLGKNEQSKQLSDNKPQIKPNTIVVFGRGTGKQEYQVTDEQLKAMKTLLENMKNIPDEDNF